MYKRQFQTQSSVQGSKEPGEGGDKTPAMTAGTEPESADSESGAETEATEADKANAPEETAGDGEEGADQAEAGAQEVLPAIDFTLKDQYGNTHSLSDYKGKTIFLNFWATWCPPCRAEMPDIQLSLIHIYTPAPSPNILALTLTPASKCSFSCQC